MNKSERDKLAQLAARLKYGNTATHDSAGFAEEIVELFPSIRGDYEFYADYTAAERVVSTMIGCLCGDGIAMVTKGKPEAVVFSALHTNILQIVDAFDDWCRESGRSAAEMVDSHIEVRELASDRGLSAFFNEAAAEEPELLLFAEALTKFQTE